MLEFPVNYLINPQGHICLPKQKNTPPTLGWVLSSTHPSIPTPPARNTIILECSMTIWEQKQSGVWSMEFLCCTSAHLREPEMNSKMKFGTEVRSGKTDDFSNRPRAESQCPGCSETNTLNESATPRAGRTHVPPAVVVVLGAGFAAPPASVETEDMGTRADEWKGR